MFYFWRALVAKKYLKLESAPLTPKQMNQNKVGVVLNPQKKKKKKKTKKHDKIVLSAKSKL